MTEPSDQPTAPEPADEAPEPEASTEVADRPAVEVVEQPSAADLAVVPHPQHGALEQAAAELMATPGAPGRDEFMVLATTARILSMSAGAPAAVRNNPWLAFHLALIGRDLGISPSAALQQIDVIGYDDRRPNDYSKVQLSLSPELLNGQIRRLGLGTIVPAASSASACTAVALAPGGRLDPRCARIWPEHVGPETNGGPCRCALDLVLGEHTFTWADAQQANLADGACVSPTEHTAACLQGGSGSSGKRCHQGYRTYPKRMMWWRAAGYAASDYFPEAGLGLYSPEELGSVVDPETGRPYDPATAALPEGYEEPERPHNPADDPFAEAMPDEAADLRARIDRITAAGGGAGQALRELWTQPTGENGDGPPTLPPFARLARRNYGKAKAMVQSIEARIKRGEWGDDTKDAWTAATEEAARVAADAANDDQGEDGEGGTPPEQPGDEPEGGNGGGSAPETPAGPETDAGDGSEPDEFDRAVADLEAADAAERRRARAQQIAADAGLPIPPDLDAEGSTWNPDDDPDGTALADRVAAEVKAMTPTAVREALVAREKHDEAAQNPQAQRKALALLIYADRGGPVPTAPPPADEPA